MNRLRVRTGDLYVSLGSMEYTLVKRWQFPSNLQPWRERIQVQNCQVLDRPSLKLSVCGCEQVSDPKSRDRCKMGAETASSHPALFTLGQVRRQCLSPQAVSKAYLTWGTVCDIYLFVDSGEVFQRSFMNQPFKNKLFFFFKCLPIALDIH